MVESRFVRERNRVFSILSLFKIAMDCALSGSFMNSIRTNPIEGELTDGGDVRLTKMSSG